MNVYNFVAESNRIEGILRPPTEKEVDATTKFIIGAHIPDLDLVVELAIIYAPERGLLRNQKGMDVCVGSHVPPKGGPQIYSELVKLLAIIGDTDPFLFHIAYETLHPFMDGNGRTGRALWAWQVWRTNPEYLDLDFLHAWYYMTLQSARN